MKHIVVIGGGIVGLTTAWSLVERGHRVSLVEREAEVAQGASHANGGQLSYRYVSPLADAGVPIKALRWLLDPDGPLRFKPEAHWQQWSWMLDFLRACSGPANRRTTARLLALGAHSQTAFAKLHREAALGDISYRAPGKLVVYRKPAEFERVSRRLKSGIQGPEQALSHDECVAIEPSLQDNDLLFAGGIFTEGEAVADCREVCLQLADRLLGHGNFAGFHRAQAKGFRLEGRRAVALATDRGDELSADGFVIAAGLQSRELAAKLGLALPLYPLKGYSLTAPIESAHRPPEVSVTDFERKILYARIGSQLRVAAMVDLVGVDLSLDPKRVDSLKRAVRDTFPQAADYGRASTWTGLRPATPSGAPILGATPFEGLWLNVGHGALGFTFSFGAADILAELISGRESPLPLDGLQFAQ